MSISERVILYQDSDLQHPFTGDPFLPTRPQHPKAYNSFTTVDPFPCYAHSKSLVEEIAAQVEEKFPVGRLPVYHISPFEDLGRTNGYTSKHWIYTDGKSSEYEPYIFLSGKRIPPHPAMTRYLVAHEYGHVVNLWIESKRGLDSGSFTAFDREYAELRGAELTNGYGGRRWHSHIGEIIANDFRILLCGVEVEFWPHDGFPRPEEVHGLAEFWQEQVEKFTAK